MRRQLTTIFAADVARYSSHVEEDEAKALTHLSELRRIMDPIITKHNGRIANSAGDSVIAIFESPVESVLAAIDIQAAHKHYNADVSHKERLQYRIGINIGDIAVQPDGDVLGAGVNIAARLESIAQPGGICVSENVFEQVDRKLPTELRKIGEHYVKNIQKPIQVYAIGDNDEALGSKVVRRSIAVMRRPAMQAAGALSAIIAVGISLYVLTRTKPPKFLDPDTIRGGLSGRAPDEILSRFDLVTTGSFDGSKYHVIRFWGGLSIEDLNALAASLGGQVASINSKEENEYLFQLSLKDDGHWVYVDDGIVPQMIGPMIGLVQEPGAREPDEGWRWLSGEPVTYLAWKADGPENSGGAQSLSLFRGLGDRPLPEWDDIGTPQRSVIIEIPEESELGSNSAKSRAVSRVSHRIGDGTD